MSKIILIVLALSILFTGYFLFPDFFKNSSGSSMPNGVKTETDNQLPQSEETPLFVSEGYRRLDNDTIIINVAVLPGVLSALWVVYGTEADVLDKKTLRTTDGLGAGGMGVVGEYGSYSLPIAPSELEPGTPYFYRVVGRTTEGETLYSGLNRFTAGK